MSAHVCGDRGGLGKPTKKMVISQISNMISHLSFHKDVTQSSFLEVKM